MPLLRLTNVSIAFGTHALLDNTQFQLDAGERVGLLGRNGEGKSTLLKLISGVLSPDEGDIWRQPSVKLACLEQEPQLSGNNCIYDAVANALGELGQWLSDYHRLSLTLATDNPEHLKALGALQHKLEAQHGWQLQQRVESTLSRLGLSPEVPVSSLSGGWKRRVALAQALVLEPDILLLDEPTNHLDLESITWLEEQLLNFSGAVLFVTHDRAFLQKLATRIVDLDRGQLVSWPGQYADYLRRKAAALDSEATQQALFDKKLAAEEVWIRQGIKARRTRNEGRVRALKQLRLERAQRRTAQGSSKLNLSQAEVSGKKVIEALDISFAYQERPIVQHFSTLIQRGDKIGLIGPNGVGKSTLLKLLLTQLQPDSGTVELGTRLQVAYFDQLREQLNPEQSVVDTIADGNEFIDIGGKKRHVMSYLGDFLFAPARARSPVKSLSGGERNRLLLARLLTKPANLIIMDEPTNDLDLETLELLEAKLVEYDGTVLLVSHDRAFLDNVVTSVLVFTGKGIIQEYVGGYSDWLQVSAANNTPSTTTAKAGIDVKAFETNNAPKKKKLSYKEQQELQHLPGLIEQLEAEQTALNAQLNMPDFYRQDSSQVKALLDKLAVLEAQLQHSYQRWDVLETLATG